MAQHLTSEQIEHARRLRAGGASYRQIAQQLGTSRQTAWKHSADVAHVAGSIRCQKLREAWASLDEAATIIGKPARRLRSLCILGEIPGACRLPPNTWLIPKTFLDKFTKGG